MKLSEVFDDDVGLCIYRKLEEEFGEEFKIQVQGVSLNTATDKDSEWIKADLLDAEDIKTRKPKNRPKTLRRGLFQVACSSRFAGRAKHKNHMQPWKLSKAVYQLFNTKSFTVLENGVGPPIGVLTVTKGRTQYIDENAVAKGSEQGFIDKSNVHSVIVSFNFQVSSL